MNGKKRPTLFSITFCVVALFLAITTPAFAARRENVLYSFCGQSGDCSNGGKPNGVIFGKDGNLYGTASYGGVNNQNVPAGLVFKLTRGVNGTWTEDVLYTFCSVYYCTDGSQPEAGLIFDGAGNLFGTTYEGGDFGFGTVFELTPGTNGSWTETVLHSFGAGNDGVLPTAGVIFDASGNLYGTTSVGGIHERGTVFELMPGANGKWTEKILHSFESPGDIQDGPAGGVVFDATGNLYGTTYGGGIVSNRCNANNDTFGCGRVFELTPDADGEWKEITLHRFNSKDGANPNAGVILDAAGNLYGTTFYGGAGHCQDGCGVVFRLSPDKDGKWTEKVIHDFGVSDKDATEPEAGLTFDSDGNLYGTASDYFYGRGAVFELVPNAKGGWTEKIVHKWGECTYGCDPDSAVIFDASGNLYGTTPYGGCAGSGQCSGTVFEVTAKPQ
jgi:uncharacterized repeat protein (TIGR03803 family)